MARSRVKALIDQYNEFTPEEQKLFLDFVAPEPEPEPSTDQPKKRRTRAPRIGLPDSQAAKAEAPKPNGQLCIATIPGLGVECGDPEDNRVHDKSAAYAGYHPFVAAAPVAEKKSKRKAAAASATQNLEIEKAAALSVSGD